MSPKDRKKHPSTSDTKRKKKKSRRFSSVSERNGKAPRSRSTLQKQASQQKKGNSAAQESGKAAKNQKRKKQGLLSDHSTKQQAACTFQRTIQDYLDDHEGGNHSHKTIEWHQTALRLMQSYMEEQRGMTLVSTIEATDISAWFTHLRKKPGARGKLRTERTVQTYARSARAFFHWLICREIITHNPFDEIIFPKVGRPLIQTITPEEFERLLEACTPLNTTSSITERAGARNRAILWLLYDTGIRLSELLNLRLKDLDRRHGVIVVRGKGAKERRIALGKNCQRHLLSYLDHHRPLDKELREWDNPGEDHLFLSETRRELTSSGIQLMFKRIKQRAGITGKRISAHIFRHTFAIRYLTLDNDPFSLQQLLGHEDMTTVRHYMHMNDETIQEQKRKFSSGDYLPALFSIQDRLENKRSKRKKR